MPRDVAQKFVARVQQEVARKQRGILKGLKGKLIERNGVVFRVVAVRRDAVIVSSARTPANQVNKMSADAFLGKKITVLGEAEPIN